jgi:hypothetical protein
MKKQPKKNKASENQMSVGAVALLDVLGWKGIWTRKKDPIADLVATISDVKALARKSRTAKAGAYWSQFNDLKSDLLLLSDTIVLTIRGDERKAVELATHIVASIIAHGLKRGLPIRGAISAGQFYVRENVFVGPAIDEVASWHEQTDWIGAVLTTSADLVVDRNGPPFTGATVLYEAPMKGGKSGKYYCVDWTFHKGTSSFDKFFGRNNLADQLKELAPITPDISPKVRNTMDFYDSLMMELSISEKVSLKKELTGQEKEIVRQFQTTKKKHHPPRAQAPVRPKVRS